MKPLRFQIKNKNIKFKSHSPKYNFLKYVTFRKWTKLVFLQVIFWSYWKIDMWKNAYIIKLWLYIFIFFGIRSIFFTWEPHKKILFGRKNLRIVKYWQFVHIQHYFSRCWSKKILLKMIPNKSSNIEFSFEQFFKI